MTRDVIAHIKWFTPDAGEGLTRLTGMEIALVVLVASSSLVLLLEGSQRFDNHRAIIRFKDQLSQLESLAPLVVRLSTAAFLFINAQHQNLLGPNVATGQGALAVATTAAFLWAGLFLALGFFTRLGTVCLLAGYMMVGLQAPLIDVLDHIEYVGIAVYLWFRGPGTSSLDNLFRPTDLPASGSAEIALLAYRFGVGLALAGTALSEKVLNVATAEAFLDRHSWNLLAFVGLPDRHFIIILGSIELALGLALAFGQASRLVVLIVLGAMLTTATILGAGEVLGHAFAIGIVVAIWLEEPFKPTEPARPMHRRLPRSKPVALSAR